MLQKRKPTLHTQNKSYIHQTTSMTTFSKAKQRKFKERKQQNNTRIRKETPRYKNYTPFCVHSPFQSIMLPTSIYVGLYRPSTCATSLVLFRVPIVPLLLRSLVECIFLQVSLFQLFRLSACRSFPMNLISSFPSVVGLLLLSSVRLF